MKTLFLNNQSNDTTITFDVLTSEELSMVKGGGVPLTRSEDVYADVN